MWQISSVWIVLLVYLEIRRQSVSPVDHFGNALSAELLERQLRAGEVAVPR